MSDGQSTAERGDLRAPVDETDSMHPVPIDHNPFRMQTLNIHRPFPIAVHAGDQLDVSLPTLARYRLE